MSLKIKNLEVKIDDLKIINDLSLEIKPGEVHVIMGPNGSGKSTLANTLMGHPKYTISSGSIEIDGNDITIQPPDVRAKAGLYLSMQYPPEITGVSMQQLLRTAYNTTHEKIMNPLDFNKYLKDKMSDLNVDSEVARRHVNVGFSGGEKKKAEVLQLSVLDPKYAILDETDSGLDVDALRIVAQGVNKYRTDEKGIVLITHYNRILDYITPDFVHIMVKGKIVKSGDASLAKEIEANGYDQFLN